MKQIVVISGKGGTGKTVITASLGALAQNKVMADCDIDAADLHLLLNPEIKERHQFKSGVTAFTNKDLCINCGKCRQVCRFDAVREDFTIDAVACEGCAFCSNVCPVGAIQMQENVSGEWFISGTRFGLLVHAKLGIAEENSGKLVSLVRQKAKEIAQKNKNDWVIVDGTPGIGCPVIASITGADCALVVIEPTLSGLYDAQRVIKVARHFQIPAKVIINKCDLNYKVTEEIKQYCQKEEIPLLGEVAFDKDVVKAMVERKTVVEYSPDSLVAKRIAEIWRKLQIQLS